MKYVIFEPEYAVPEAMIFSDNVIHKVAAACYKTKPVAAGFFNCSNGVIKCYGKSDSLKLNSRPLIDKDIVLDQLIRSGFI